MEREWKYKGKDQRYDLHVITDFRNVVEIKDWKIGRLGDLGDRSGDLEIREIGRLKDENWKKIG